MERFNEIENKISVKYKIAFFSTILFGLFSQGMGIVNKYSVHDDVALFGIGATTTSGRWMLDILGFWDVKIFGDGHFSLPLFNGVLTIIAIGLCACLIVNLLDLKSFAACSFVGGILISFPTITSLLGFMFTSHFYAFATLLATIGAYLICKKDNYIFKFIGVLAAACATGTYQSYLCFCASLIITYYINVWFFEAGDKKKIRNFILAFICMVLILVFYVVINKIYLNFKEASLVDYRGISTMGMTSIGGYLNRLTLACKEFIWPKRGTLYYMFPFSKLIYITVVWGSYGLLILKMIGNVKHEKSNIIICFLLLMVFPVCTNMVFLMVEEKEIYSLMMYSQTTIFLLFSVVIEKTIVNWKVLGKYISIIVSVFMLLIVMEYSRYDNKCYLKAEIIQSEAINYFNGMINRIRSLPQYNDDMNIVYINEGKINDLTLTKLDDLSDINLTPYYDIDGYLNSYSWNRFVQIWCGFNQKVGDKSQFENRDDVKTMPSYPDDGSIKIIDDAIVVKF